VPSPPLLRKPQHGFSTLAILRFCLFWWGDYVSQGNADSRCIQRVDRPGGWSATGIFQICPAGSVGRRKEVCDRTKLASSLHLPSTCFAPAFAIPHHPTFVTFHFRSANSFPPDRSRGCSSLLAPRHILLRNDGQRHGHDRVVRRQHL
jgi:hypothetical protein